MTKYNPVSSYVHLSLKGTGWQNRHAKNINVTVPSVTNPYTTEIFLHGLQKQLSLRDGVMSIPLCIHYSLGQSPQACVCCPDKKGQNRGQDLRLHRV